MIGYFAAHARTDYVGFRDLPPVFVRDVASVAYPTRINSYGSEPFDGMAWI